MPSLHLYMKLIAKVYSQQEKSVIKETKVFDGEAHVYMHVSERDSIAGSVVSLCLMKLVSLIVILEVWIVNCRMQWRRMKAVFHIILEFL